MSYLIVGEESIPTTPAAATIAEFVESTTSRAAYIDGRGDLNYMTQRVVPNLILNSGLAYWQRATSGPGTYVSFSNTSGRTYWADGMGVTNSTTNVQAKRVDSVAAAEAGLDSRYYASIKKVTNSGKVVLSFPILADQSFPLRGRLVRVRCKMRLITGSGFGTMRLGLLALSSSGTADSLPATFVAAFGSASTDPTWGTNLSAISPTTADSVLAGGGTQVSSGTGVTCTVSGSWARFSGSFLVPAGTQNLVVVIFTDGLPAINDELGIAEVMLTEGQQLRDYVPADPTTELEAVLRQYFKTFLTDTGPAQNVGVNTAEWTWDNGIATAAGNHSPQFRYPLPMRISPTLTFFNPAAANALIRDETAGGDTSANSTVGANANGFRLDYTGNAGGIVGGVAGVHLTAEAGL